MSQRSTRTALRTSSTTTETLNIMFQVPGFAENHRRGYIPCILTIASRQAMRLQRLVCRTYSMPMMNRCSCLRSSFVWGVVCIMGFAFCVGCFRTFALSWLCSPSRRIFFATSGVKRGGKAGGHFGFSFVKKALNFLFF